MPAYSTARILRDGSVSASWRCHLRHGAVAHSVQQPLAPGRCRVLVRRRMALGALFWPAPTLLCRARVRRFGLHVSIRAGLGLLQRGDSSLLYYAMRPLAVRNRTRRKGPVRVFSNNPGPTVGVASTPERHHGRQHVPVPLVKCCPLNDIENSGHGNTDEHWGGPSESRVRGSCAVVSAAPVLHRRRSLATSPSTESQARHVHDPPSHAPRCTRWRLEHSAWFPHPRPESRCRTRPRTPSVTRTRRASRLPGRHGTRSLVRACLHLRPHAAR